MAHKGNITAELAARAATSKSVWRKLTEKDFITNHLTPSEAIWRGKVVRLGRGMTQEDTIGVPPVAVTARTHMACAAAVGKIAVVPPKCKIFYF